MDSWQIKDNGIERLRRSGMAMKDHFAMAGRNCDVILEWSVNAESGEFAAVCRTRFPMFRTLPNNTHAALEHEFKLSAAVFDYNLHPVAGQVEKVRIDGVFKVYIKHDNLLEVRTIFPSAAIPAVYEVVEVTSTAASCCAVTVNDRHHCEFSAPGVSGVYRLFTDTQEGGVYLLAPGDTVQFARVYSAALPNTAAVGSAWQDELAARLERVKALRSVPELDTPDEKLNLMFSFALLHTQESIFDTPNGPVHSPGGYMRYLAAIWANDQAEYANPLFAFLPDQLANQAALNSFRWFKHYMNAEYRPLPSSIICGGTDFWNGAGDRGDMAMIAHGAARYALTSGRPAIGRELWPLIEWCLEFCRRKINACGVVESDADELEGRFPAGNANLCTNMLYFDALLRAADLAVALGKNSGEEFRRQAGELHKNITAYFAGTVEDFETYRYYEGNTVLRSWICMPLVFGLTERKAGTVAALFSDKLWFGDGMLTASGTETYWDRTLLYALRGVFACGEADIALEKLSCYTQSRLLGSHVPYAVEAYPEGNQSQLSAESALYCRIFTEGLFGILPTGFNRCTITVQLPEKWDFANLNNLNGFKQKWSIQVKRLPDNDLELTVLAKDKIIYQKTAPNGTAHNIEF